MPLHIPSGGRHHHGAAASRLPRRSRPFAASRQSVATLAAPAVLLPRARALALVVAQSSSGETSSSSALADAALARGDPPIVRAVVQETCALLDAVVAAAAPTLDARAALEVLQLGGVYLGSRPSGPRGPLKWRRQRPEGRRRAGAGDDDDDDDDAEPWWRRPVAAGVPIRVHASPKRFCAACGAVRVLSVDDDYVVIAKPAGLPSMAHESNDAEHAAPCAERALLRERGGGAADSPLAPSLQLCHRLDTWTSGVLVLATSPGAAARFGEALRGDGDGNDDGAPFAEKTYLALTRGAPSSASYPRTLVAWMYDGPWGDAVPAAGGLPLGARGPRLLAPAEPEPPLDGPSGGRSWKRCELVVERAEPAPEAARRWAEAADARAREEMAAAAAAAAGDDDAADGSSGAPAEKSPEQPASPPEYHLLTIRLVTGRTHQIRAQMAAAGCPVAGDSMYAPLVGVLADPATGAVDAKGGAAAVRRAAQAQLSGPLGLHAWRLRWRAKGETVLREYVAKAPWDEEGLSALI